MAGKWSDSESNLKQNISEIGHLCVISASILVASEALYQWCMRLTISNYLPGSGIIPVTNDD